MLNFCGKLNSYTLLTNSETGKPKSGKFFFSVSIAVLQCLQLDSRKRSACVIIFNLHLSSLITCNFESSQAVKTFVEGYSI